MISAEESLKSVRQRQIATMRLTCDTLGHVIGPLSAEQARELRDGPQGWSIVEIVCHLRDFDEIFYQRALMMLNEEQPKLPAYDHEAMAIERGYQEQDFNEAYLTLRRSRRRFCDFFASLSPQQWQSGGHHPERDSFDMTDAAMQVGLHDLDHLEQITRVLASA